MTTIAVAGEPVEVDVRRAGTIVEGRVGATRLRADVTRTADGWRIALADRTLVATVVREGDEVWVAIGGEVYRCRAEEAGLAVPAGAHAPRVVAPMPGKVLDVLVAEGQEVTAGESLVVLEAMKMETVATADAAGRVVRVHVRVGVMVEPGQILVELAFS